MLQHALGVKVRNKERDIVALDWFPSQDEKRFGSLRQKSGELMYQDCFNFVCLLDLDAYSHAIDTRLNVHSLILVSRYCKRV